MRNYPRGRPPSSSSSSSSHAAAVVLVVVDVLVVVVVIVVVVVSLVFVVAAVVGVVVFLPNPKTSPGVRSGSTSEGDPAWFDLRTSILDEGRTDIDQKYLHST